MDIFSVAQEENVKVRSLKAVRVEGNIQIEKSISDIVRDLRKVEESINMIFTEESSELNKHSQSTGLENVLNEDIEWKFLFLKDIVKRLEYSRSIKANKIPAAEGNWGILKTSAISKGIFNPKENKEIINHEPINNHYEVRNEDLLFNRANSEEIIGASVLVRNTPPHLIISDKIWRVIFKAEYTNACYLYLVLNTPTIRAQLRSHAHGILSMRNITQHNFLNLYIPLPLITTQEALKEKFNKFWDVAFKYQQALPPSNNFLFLLLENLFEGKITMQWWNENSKGEV
ncbi:restriction endonuclease subunit S [Tengunoibacter tsumagoiensis]|uniref:Uncharacterized protein n=1 Tax=Tengunoibacter tsumagoiensis TaxID=2014871 RepID=A0A401ZY94_9CHLR|nr:restriction endonuclease subunit S [Tengunoibacter tsumagoiensis]GCE11819.1 hypothetical protein KTT_16780 [Tengunoibacter tsumagoiensis]